MTYLAPLICYAAAAAYVLHRHRRRDHPVPQTLWLSMIRDCALVYLLIGGTNALLGAFAGAAAIPGAAVIVLCLLAAGQTLLRHLRPDTPASVLLRRTAAAAAVILLLECFGMNWESFGRQSSTPLPLDTVSISGDAEETNGVLVMNGETTLTIDTPSADARYVLADVEVEAQHLPLLVRLSMKDDDFTTQYQTVQERWISPGQKICSR